MFDVHSYATWNNKILDYEIETFNVTTSHVQKPSFLKQ